MIFWFIINETKFDRQRITNYNVSVKLLQQLFFVCKFINICQGEYYPNNAENAIYD